MASSSNSRSSSPARTTTTAEAVNSSRFTVVSPPTIILPSSYADAALLHVLATKPDTVIPPGKSLRSALLRPEIVSTNTDGNTNENLNAPQSLQSTVQEIVHRAFWDEARESLSDSDPSRQLTRLRLLYKDLNAALDGLLPRSNPYYVTFSDPLSPTPAPLLSARQHLIDLTSALQERCAPVRDAQLTSIRSLLQSDAASDLPDRIVQAIKQLLEIAEVMKKDLSNAVLGAVSDEDLEKEVIQIARIEERRAILEIYGIRSIRDRWNAWLVDEEVQGDDNSHRWVRRLVKALGADMAISCPLPTHSGSGPDASPSPTFSNGTQSNAVPPVFALSSSDLYHLQNHIQALVIAAVLRTLVPLHPSYVTSSTKTKDVAQPTERRYEDTTESPTFAERILSLLMIEVDETSEDAGTTKLVNLADEVLREHRRLQASSSPTSLADDSSAPPEGLNPPPVNEQTIRSRVDALLKPTNPVFILLRKRLLATLADSVISAISSEAQERDKDKGKRIPEAMHTGRGQEREAKRPRRDFSNSPSTSLDPHEKRYLHYLVELLVRNGKLHTKGYEDPVLVRGVGDVVTELADVIEWVRDTWAGHGLELVGLDSVGSHSDWNRESEKAEGQRESQEGDDGSEEA